jgi:hypothetical protein
MAFEWHYAECPCCRAVIPDSRPDDLGECQLCSTPRVLLDGPPADWFEILQEVDDRGRVRKPRSAHQERWENRPIQERCQHERRLVAVK